MSSSLDPVRTDSYPESGIARCPLERDNGSNVGGHVADNLVDLLVPSDDPEVRRLNKIVERLPESRRIELMSTLLRAVVAYEGTKDPCVLECFASAVRVTLRLHAADVDYAAALERAAQQRPGLPLSREEVAGLFPR